MGIGIGLDAKIKPFVLEETAMADAQKLTPEQKVKAAQARADADTQAFVDGPSTKREAYHMGLINAGRIIQAALDNGIATGND